MAYGPPATAAAGSAASEWPRFRGPNGAGSSAAPDLPLTWTDKDYRWKAELPGIGHASPVIGNGRVFLFCADKTSAQRYLLALKTADGSVAWKREYASSTFPKNRDNSYASSTPALDAERVYAYWTTTEEVTVTALEQATGKELWQRKLGPYKSQHGSGTSPVVWRGLVIVNNDQEGPSSLIALDATTGATKWEVARRKDRAAYSTPILRETGAGDPEMIFTSSAHGFTALDPNSGKTKWEFADAFPFRVVGSPIFAEGLVMGSCGEGGIGRRFVAVRPPSKDRGPELAYEMKNSIPYVPSPLCHAGWLFLWGDNGLVCCHRAATGEKVWQRKLSDSFYASPVCAAGRLYGVSKTGKVYVLSASGRDELLGTATLGEASFASPAIAENALFFRTESHLFCVGARP